MWRKLLQNGVALFSFKTSIINTTSEQTFEGSGAGTGSGSGVERTRDGRIEMKVSRE
jgi:hypothetical protein